MPSGREPAQEAVVIADVVGKLCGTFGGEYFEMRVFCIVCTFQIGGRTDVAKNEMAIAVAPF